LKPRIFRTVLVFAVLALIPATRLRAQQLAALSVNVTDPSGGGIPQALVTIKNVETGAKRTESSNATGLAVIPGLAAGDYELTVQAGQFSEYRATLTVAVGQIASLPVRLGVNEVREQVEVREAAQAGRASRGIDKSGAHVRVSSTDWRNPGHRPCAQDSSRRLLPRDDTGLKRRKARALPWTRWGRRPQTSFYMFRDWHRHRACQPYHVFYESSSKNSRRAALKAPR